MSFTIGGKNGSNYAATVPYSEDLKTNSKGYVGFTFYVNTIQMADMITATLNYGDGQTLVKTYSVKEYFEAFDAAYEAHPELYTPEITALIKATADLGHYMQPYLETRGNWSVANGDHAEMDVVYEQSIGNYLDDTTAAVAEHALNVATDGDISEFKKVNYTVNFESKMSINVIVQMKTTFSGTPMATASYEDDNGVTQNVDCTVTPQTATKFLIGIPNIQAHQLSRVFEIAISTEKGTLMLTGSGLSYAQMILAGANGNNVTQNAAIALYRYSQAADVVKGNPSDVNKTNGNSNN